MNTSDNLYFEKMTYWRLRHVYRDYDNIICISRNRNNNFFTFVYNTIYKRNMLIRKTNNFFFYIKQTTHVWLEGFRINTVGDTGIV